MEKTGKLRAEIESLLNFTIPGGSPDQILEGRAINPNYRSMSSGSYSIVRIHDPMVDLSVVKPAKLVGVNEGTAVDAGAPGEENKYIEPVIETSVAARVAKTSVDFKINTKVPDQVINNMIIWISASILDLSPKLYFIGYYNTNPVFQGFGAAGVSSLLYAFTIINEAYPMNLSEYLCSLEQTGMPTDQVEQKLIHETERIIQQMTLIMKLLCFDVKPGNIVVTRGEDGLPKVRFIDWDDDWCKDFYNYKGLDKGWM